jgi:large subunit ribosomal protein L29
MKNKEIRTLTPEKLREELAESRKTLFRLCLQRSAGQVEKPHRFAALRRNIARLRTIQNEMKTVGGNRGQ